MATNDAGASAQRTGRDELERAYEAARSFLRELGELVDRAYPMADPAFAGALIGPVLRVNDSGESEELDRTPEHIGERLRGLGDHATELHRLSTPTTLDAARKSHNQAELPIRVPENAKPCGSYLEAVDHLARRVERLVAWIDHPIAEPIDRLAHFGRIDFGAVDVRLLGERDAVLAAATQDARAGDFRPARWFAKGMAGTLRKAAAPTRKGQRVASRTIDGVVCYSVADARRWWPDRVPE